MPVEISYDAGGLRASAAQHDATARGCRAVAAGLGEPAPAADAFGQVAAAAEFRDAVDAVRAALERASAAEAGRRDTLTAQVDRIAGLGDQLTSDTARVAGAAAPGG